MTLFLLQNRIGKMRRAAASSQLKSKGSLPQVLSPVKLHSMLGAQAPGHNSIRDVTNAEMSSFGLNPEDTMPFTPEASQTSCRLLLNSTQITDRPRMNATSPVSERSLHVSNLSPISLDRNDRASTRFLDENVLPRMEWMSKAVTPSLFPLLKKKVLVAGTEQSEQDKTVSIKVPVSKRSSFQTSMSDDPSLMTKPKTSKHLRCSPGQMRTLENGPKVAKRSLPLSVKYFDPSPLDSDQITETLGSKTATSPKGSDVPRKEVVKSAANVHSPVHPHGTPVRDTSCSSVGGHDENLKELWGTFSESQVVQPPGSVRPTSDGSSAMDLCCENRGSYSRMKEQWRASSKGGSFGENSAISVAVRVRPLTQREQQVGTKCVVSLSGKEILIHHPPTNRQLTFSYDYCFGSQNPEDKGYASQEVVYSLLAQPLLDKVFDGYNTCLFAYGQTGSGKSYTMTGYADEVGIIPRFCKEIFWKVNLTQQEEVKHHVELSYFEVYNERIHDLLTSSKDANAKKKALKVREHPILGPYVTGLSTYVVGSFADVQTWLELGNKQRATAATSMNERSSRSHSVFKLVVAQSKREHLEGEEHDHMVVSHVNLVDLSGSERCNLAQTSGLRTKEGASINKSLLTLGKVISALSEMAQFRRKCFIPYRDSVLTWLLKESLGGNSKTAMIATVSPAAAHVEETLSTLRYASQARSIINVAKVNEDSNAVLIRELKVEIEKLRTAQQCSQGIDVLKYEASLQEIQYLKEQLAERERELAESQKSWQEKLALAEQHKMEEEQELQKAGVCFKVDNHLPNLVNLNEDPQLSEMLLYIIKEGETRVGSLHPDSEHDIQLTGALISEDHCVITNVQGAVTLRPIPDARTFVNGNLLAEAVTLHHGDRVILGGNHYFRFNHPTEVKNGRRASLMPAGGADGLRDFEFAKNELVEAQKQRIEIEVEKARLQAQKEMMEELQMAKELAQQELWAQRRLYEDRIEQLEEEMNKKLLSTRKAAEELLVQLPALAQAQGTQQKRSKFLGLLEQEKEKLAQELELLQQTRANKEQGRKSVSAENQAQWTALQLSIMLQEVNVISKSLNKHTIFSRYDLPAMDGEPTTVCIQVTNTKLGICTLWNLEKFEEKLVSMREMYQGSYDGNGESLFYDLTGTWEAVVKPPSPNRGRSLLSRQTSGKLLGKVLLDAPVQNASCAAVCKLLIGSAMEALGKEGESGSLLLKMLLDLKAVLDSSAAIAQACEQCVYSTAMVSDDRSIQPHCIKVSSAIEQLAVCVRLLEACAPGSGALKDHLEAEVKKLGGNVAFLLNGCECDIASMILESKEQIEQSVIAVASWLGQLTVAVGLEANLEGAEFLPNNVTEAVTGGAESYIDMQIDKNTAELLDLQRQNLSSEKQLAETVRRRFLSVGSSLQCFMEKCKIFWREFESLKKQKSEKPPSLSFQERVSCYKTLSCDLNALQVAWKRASTIALQCLKADQDPDLAKLKQATETFSKTAVLLAKTFDALCSAAQAESPHQSVYQLAVVTKQTEAAASQIHSSARDLLQLAETLGCDNCLRSGMEALKNKRQLPMNPGPDSSIHLRGRSGNYVRVAVAKLNRALIKREPLP
ncbi:kinesin family member 14 [Chelydra serpentina]|uniref:Kinesin-like protein KIF14 n=1 Tax=Chelydra serpentina TaxID=8475 RepID=A0A8T1TBC0_CHESE|nr:kinesin family member 14 [Chelydra serpentina]